MRTVHVNPARQFHGGEGQTLALCAGLIERGHDVVLITQPGAPLAERARAAGVAVHEVRMRTEFDLGAAAHIRRLLRDTRADVLHCHTGMAHGLGWFASRGRRDWKLVVTRRVLRPIRRGLFTRLKYRGGVDAFVAVSGAARRQLLDYGVAPTRVRLVHDACVEGEAAGRPARPETFGIEPDDFVIGAIGQLAACKDQRTLLSAAGMLRRRGRRFRLLVVGDGTLRGPLERQAQHEGIADVAVFAGYVQDIRSLLRRMNVLAMPSVREALGSVVLRAFDAGVPVVAADAGGLPEMVRAGETGLLFRAGDAAALARELERLLDRPAPHEMIENARRLLDEQFRPWHMVDGNLAVYERVLDESRARTADPIVERNGRRTLYVRPEWQTRLADTDLRGAVRHAPRAPGLAGRGDLRVLDLDGARLLCKQMRHGGLLGGLLGDCYIDRRKPLNEMRVVAHALSHEVPTAELPAVMTQRSVLPFYRYWVFSRELPAAVDMLGYLRTRRARRERIPAVAAAARAVRAMHDAGLFHADLNLKNLLVRPDGAGGAEAFVIDFDKARLAPHMSVRRRFRNLRRLWKSAEKARSAGFAITPSDMLRFLVEYAGPDLPCYLELVERAPTMRWHRWRYRHEVLTTRPR